MDVGLVCDQCDTFNPMTSRTCGGCGAAISLDGPSASSTPAPGAPARPAPAGASRLCPKCRAPVAGGLRFCGKCGTTMEAGDLVASTKPETEGRRGGRTMFFGTMQTPGRAKLILIKGEGLDGISYHLSGTDHIAGRLEGAILFPEDPMLSPRHANFFYRDQRLHVRDEGSINGVFVRIRQPTLLYSGDLFLMGEQLLQIELEVGSDEPMVDEEGTLFYSSPKRPSKLKLRQLLRGGHLGMVYRARADRVTLGREGNDINFPEDPFVSGHHTEVRVEEDHVVLTDLGSRNGTFMRVVEEARLEHGDYVFLGQQLLRVEIT